MEIEAREWTHFCFVVSNKVQKMYIGNKLFEFECPEKLAFRTEKVKLTRIFGGAGLYDGSLPFSGEVADLRIYEKHLSKKEVQSVSQVKKIDGKPLGFTLPTSKTDKEPKDVKDKIADKTQGKEGAATGKQVAGANRQKRNAPSPDNSPAELGIEAITIKSIILLSEKSNTLVMIMQKHTNYKRSETICKAMGGTLISKINAKNLAQILTYVEKTGIGASRLWLLQRPEKVGSDYCEMVSDETDISVPRYSSCKNNVASTACILLKKNPLKLYGSSERLTNFYPIPNKHLEFENNQNLRLKFDSKQQFILEKITTNQVWASAYGLDEFDFMGRHSFFIGPGNEDFAFLTFTSCSSSMFTCPNGLCINITDTCNFVANCEPTGFDEDVCNVGIPHEAFYEKTLAPMKFDPNSSKKSRKAQLSLNLELERLVDVDMDNSVIKMALSYTTLWRDDRLLFKFLVKDIYRPVEKNIYKKIWHPTVNIPEASSKFKKIFYQLENQGIVEAKSTVNGHFKIYKEYEGKCMKLFYLFLELLIFISDIAIIHEGKDVELKHTISEEVKVLCSLSLFLYPFDSPVICL